MNRVSQWRRVRSLWMVAPLLGLMAMAAAPEKVPVEASYFSIGTGSSSGTYYPVGSLISTVVSHPVGSIRCKVPSACGPEGLIAVAITSPGSVANLHNLAEGRVASAFVQANLAAWAYQGAGVFTGQPAMTELRAIARLYPETVHLAVARDTGIQTIADLKGRRISVDIEGSGTYVEALAILKAEKLDKRLVDLVQADADRSADLLAARQIDGFFFVGGAPVDAIMGLAAIGSIDLVPITGAAVAALEANSPYFTRAEIPADTYPGIAATQTVAIGALWLVPASADDALIYQLTSALWDNTNQPFLMRGHAQARAMDQNQALEGLPVPLHPGAERYYREKGLMPGSEATLPVADIGD